MLCTFSRSNKWSRCTTDDGTRATRSGAGITLRLVKISATEAVVPNQRVKIRTKRTGLTPRQQENGEQKK